VALSDGVYGQIMSDEIAYILRSDYSLGKKIDWLFTLANDRGNKDNQSTILLQY
jgi:serine/threonine protein phosphatase PrpC